MKKQHNQYRRKARRAAVGNDTLLDNIELEEGETLFSTLKDDVKPVISPTTPSPSGRVGVGLPGIIAEAFLGECELCEPIEDGTSQDWFLPTLRGGSGWGFKTDEPSVINPLDTSSRYQNPGDLKAKDMQQPIINIQNAPTAPDPTGMQ